MTETTDTIPTSVKLAMFAALCCYLSACSGPFGIVLGPESTHNAYNRRVAIERQIVAGNELTERDRHELQSLLNDIK
jgi:hypothetical protein